MLTVPTFSLSYRFERSLRSVVELGVVSVVCSRAIIRVKFMELVSKVEAPGIFVVDIVASLFELLHC